MEIRLLGSVELRIRGRAVNVGGPRQRAIVAVLALDAGRLVRMPVLVDRVWGQDPPSRVRHAVQVYVARFRRLVRTGTEDPASVQILHRCDGYLLDVDPDRVDAHRFGRLLDAAHSPACPETERVTRLSAALALWCGPPLADLPGAWASSVGTAWLQRYLDAVVLWARATAIAGRPGIALPRLTELTAEYPLVESLSAALMRALCAVGRRAEALLHFAKVGRLLADELGADPGPELRRLHLQILNGDL